MNKKKAKRNQEKIKKKKKKKLTSNVNNLRFALRFFKYYLIVNSP